MDMLAARYPHGGLHSLSADHPPGFGERFSATMQVQGFVVTRYSEEEWKAFCESRRSQNSQTAPKPAFTPAIRTLECESALPHIGQNIIHHVIGYATVTHTITLDSQPVPVATGPKGSGLVRPGEWREASEADKPFWMRQATATDDTLERIAPAPVMQAAAVSTRVDSPAAPPAPLSPEPALSRGTPAFKPGDWICRTEHGIPHLVGSNGTSTRCGLGIRSTALLADQRKWIPVTEERCHHCEKAARLERESNARRGHA